MATAFMLTLACGGVDPVNTGSEDLASRGADTLSIVLQIGDEIGDSTTCFGSIVDARIDSQGRIFVLDEMEACLKVYDMEGNYIQQVSRIGSGPGESRYVKGMFLMPDGRVSILSSDKNGYIVFDDSLRFLEEIDLWMENSPYQVTPLSNDRLAVCRYDENESTDCVRHAVAIYEWDSDHWETLLWKDSLEVTGVYGENPSETYCFIEINQLSTGGVGDGMVYFAPISPYDYRVIGWDSTGSEVLNISRDIPPLPKTAEQIEYELFYVNSVFELRSGGRQLPFEFEPEPYCNLITQVDIGPDGNLWVRRGTCSGLFFDIYDFEGNLLRHAIYPDSGWSWETEGAPYGILAWEMDPYEGYQKLYLLR